MTDALKMSLENWDAWQKQLGKALEQVSSLKVPLSLIADDFYKSERAIFQLKSKGAYEDLSEKYKKRKIKEKGFAYPILKRDGDLEKSLTVRGGPGNITIVEDKFLIVGSAVPYAAVHQFGAPSKNIPSRPIVFIGPETSKFEASDRAGLGGRLTRWSNILDGYVKAVLENTVEKI